MSQPIVSIPQCDVKRRATPFFSTPPSHSELGPGKKREITTDRPVPLLWLADGDYGTREAHVTLSLNGRFYIGDDPTPYEPVEAKRDIAVLAHTCVGQDGASRRSLVVMPFCYFWDLYEWYEDYVPPILFFLGDTLTADLLAHRVHFGSAESAQVFAREYPQWVVTHE